MMARTCKHYTGQTMYHRDGICEAGVDIRARLEEAGAQLALFRCAPCFERNAPAFDCPHRVFPTPEEQAERRRRNEKQARHCLEVLHLITLEQDLSGRDAGSVDCPACGNQVDFRVIGKGRDLLVRCRTDDCLAFM